MRNPFNSRVLRHNALNPAATGPAVQSRSSRTAFPVRLSTRRRHVSPFPAPRDYNQANGVLRAAKPILRLPHMR